MSTTETEVETAPLLPNSPVRSPARSPPISPNYTQPPSLPTHAARSRAGSANGFPGSPSRTHASPNTSSELGRAFVYSPTMLSATNPFLTDVHSAHSQIPSPSPVFNPLQQSPASPAHGAFSRPQSAKTVTSSAHSQPISAPVVSASPAPPPAPRRHKVNKQGSTSPAANPSSSATAESVTASSYTTSTNNDDEATPPEPPPRKSLQLPVIGKPVTSPDLPKASGDTGIPVKTRAKKKSSETVLTGVNSAGKTRGEEGDVVSTRLG